MRNYWPGLILGLAYDGSVVQLNRLRCVDFRTIMDEPTLLAAALRHAVYLNELARLLTPSGEQTMIFDLGASDLEYHTDVATAEDPAGTAAFLAAVSRHVLPHYPR